MKNFCLNKTQSERFSKRGAKSTASARTSSFLTESVGDIDEDEAKVLGQSVIDTMHTRTHDDRACSFIFNCFDMCCLGQYPDQVQMYRIQKKKMEGQRAILVEHGNDEDVAALTGWREQSNDPLGSDSDEIEQDVGRSSKKFVKTPKVPGQAGKSKANTVQ